MPEQLPITGKDAPAPAQPERLIDRRRLRWFELCLVLLVACGGSFLSSLYILRNGPNELPHASDLRWSNGMVHEVAGLLLLGYVLSRRRLRFKDIGLRWSLRDAGTGLLVAIASYATYAVGYTVVHLVHAAIFPSAAKGPTAIAFFGHPTMMTIPFTLLNPFFEELIVRAYLMTEIKDLTGSSALAVAASVLVQSSYHLYYGWAVALSLSFQFLIFALYFARTRKVLPVIVAHGIFDVYWMLQLW